MEVSGYSMDLYCDDPNHAEKAPYKFQSIDGEYTDETRGPCVTAARKDGWKFKKNGEVICPYCTGKKTQ